MRYVQEAPLGKHGGDIAPRTEGCLALEGLKEDVMTRLSKKGAPSADVKAVNASVELVADRVLGLLKERAPPKEDELAAQLGSVLDGLQASMRSLRADLDGAMGTSIPTFVKCDSEESMAHVTASSLRASCGYKWKEAGAAPIPQYVWASLLACAPGGKCTRCSKRAPADA